MENKTTSPDRLPPPPPSLGRSLNFSAGAMNRLCQALLAEHELSLPQWVILSALWRSDGLNVNDLASYNGSNPPAASRLVDRMVDAGLVRRRADKADGRAVRVYLTAKGAKLRILADFHESVNERLLVGFSDRETSSLFALLDRVLVNARTALDDLASDDDSS